MNSSLSLLLATFIALLCQIANAQQHSDFVSQTQPLLEKYCYSCHGETKKKGGITLHSLTSEDTAFRKYELLESMLHQIRDEDMPPDDEDLLPTAEEKKQLISALSSIITRVKSGDVPPNAGRVTIRRLNKNEYNRTVRDLFGVKFNPGRNFPADGSGGEGFDNVGDALFSTPSLLEKYLAAAKKVTAQIYKDPLLKKKVIIARPGNKLSPLDAAKKVLTYHATLAYRHRVTDEDLAPLLVSFNRALQKGAKYDDALRAPLTALLVSPRFLFREEHDEANKDEWKLNAFEVATRLSYFLWSSMPDRELFRSADSGKLNDPKELRKQAIRMLDDPRSSALAQHFGGQWIGYDKLVDEINPDTKRFPEFTTDLRKAMYYEGIEFFEHLIQKNRPITDLIDSDYTFANSLLAKHYGLKSQPKGADMQKISLTNPNRGGVLGMGAVLTSTSLPLRTSPVLRGVWILDTMLGDPPPPPPPDAGELPADDTQAKGLSFREQLEIHRTATECASCHARIDPLGFSLENYDAIGKWREKDLNGNILNTKATIKGGVTFSSPTDLKKLMLQGKDKFARNMSRKMLSYALGRGLEYYDEPAINSFIQTLKADDYKTRSLILAVIESRPFLYRSNSR